MYCEGYTIDISSQPLMDGIWINGVVDANYVKFTSQMHAWINQSDPSPAVKSNIFTLA